MKAGSLVSTSPSDCLPSVALLLCHLVSWSHRPWPTERLKLSMSGYQYSVSTRLASAVTVLKTHAWVSDVFEIRLNSA
jgi:hypothetical protein